VRKLVSILALVALSALAFASLSAARPAASHLRLTATLNAGQEVPKQAVKDQAAHGTFTGALTGTTLKWKLTFAKLTGGATAAHIHLGGMGKAGNVIVPLCGPCTSGKAGKTTITKANIDAIEGGKAYVNVHTTKNPGGEIRGQVKLTG
jgi:hypothetical protein